MENLTDLRENEIKFEPDDWEIGMLLKRFCLDVKKKTPSSGFLSLGLMDDLVEEYSTRMKLLFKLGDGSLFSFDEFINNVNVGCFDDDDGIGYIVDEEGNNLGQINCSVNWLKSHKKDNHYIVWYNK